MNALIKQPNSISINHDGGSGSQEKATRLPHIVRACFFALIILSMLAVNFTAQAQTTPDMSNYTAENIGAAAGDNDLSKQILSGLAGADKVSTWTAPLVPGTPTTLLGNIIFAMNACIYGLITGAIIWIVITQVSVSASDGTVLGKQISGVWAPIRAGIGSIGGLPVFGGFSLLQSLVLMFAILGIGLANIMSNAAWDHVSDGMPLVPVMQSKTDPNITNDLHDLIKNTFALEICRDASNYAAQQLSAGLSYREIPPAAESSQNDVVTYSFGTCGYVQLQTRSGKSPGTSTSLGFTVDSVDYSGVADSVHAAARTAMSSVVQQVTALADGMYAQYTTATYNTADSAAASDDLKNIVGTSITQLKAIETQVNAQLSAGIKDGSSKADATNSQYVAAVKRGGWLNLGLSSGTFFAQSAAVNDAMRSFTFSSNPLYLNSSDKFVADAEQFWGLANVANQNGEQENQTGGWFDSFFATPTGNVSLGQNIASAIVNNTFSGSGGGSDVNPIVAMKNLGDYMMTIGETLLGADFIMHTPLAYVIPGGAVVKKMMDSKLGAMAEPVAWGLIALGLFLSIYIPGLMFLLFLAAVLEWLVQIVEALIYAQISALMFIDIRQEGLMQGASSKFILACLSVLLRPALIVVAFFVAMILQIKLGTYFLQAYSTWIANIQGNSVTGLLSIIGLVLLAAIYIGGLVQVTGNLMSTIPAALLNWTGGGSESKHNNTFIGKHTGDAIRNGAPSTQMSGEKSPGAPGGLSVTAISKAAKKGLL